MQKPKGKEWYVTALIAKTFEIHVWNVLNKKM